MIQLAAEVFGIHSNLVSPLRVRFGDYVLDSGTGELARCGRAVPVSPKVDFLELLLERRPEAVAKEAIHDRLWPSSFVSESSLARLAAEAQGRARRRCPQAALLSTWPRLHLLWRGRRRSERASGRGSPPDHDRDSGHSLEPGANVLGRGDEAAVSIPSTKASRRHARIVVDERNAPCSKTSRADGLVLGRAHRRLRVPSPRASRSASERLVMTCRVTPGAPHGPPSSSPTGAALTSLGAVGTCPGVERTPRSRATGSAPEVADLPRRGRHGGGLSRPGRPPRARRRDQGDPPAAAADPDRLRRFELEARATSALSHPNLLTLFDIGTEEGRVFLVMELLEGRSCAKSSRRRGDSSQEGPRLGGADRARPRRRPRQGDRPPRSQAREPVRDRGTGAVKILDFGLAKLRHPRERAGLEPGFHPFTGCRGHDAGTVLGTVGYMSPEQVRLLPVDARSDLFSFRTILYEMYRGNGPSGRHRPTRCTRSSAQEIPRAVSRAEHVSDHHPGRPCAVSRRAPTSASSPRAIWLSTSRRSPRPPSCVPRPPGSSAPQPCALRDGQDFSSRIARCSISSATGRARRAPSFQRMTFRSGLVFSARFGADGRTVVYSAAWQGRPLEVFRDRRGEQFLSAPGASRSAAPRALRDERDGPLPEARRSPAGSSHRRPSPGRPWPAVSRASCWKTSRTPTGRRMGRPSRSCTSWRMRPVSSFPSVTCCTRPPHPIG